LVAVYSGNDPSTNGTTHDAACGDANEDVVTSVKSSMSTAQIWVPNDSATITAPAGSGSLAGTVTFTLHDNGDCTGTVVYGPVDRAVAGPVAGVTVETSNTTAMTASGTFSWKVAYDSTNAAQEDIPGSCHETSALTVGNRGTVSGP
jgi:hypothetical protein